MVSLVVGLGLAAALGSGPAMAGPSLRQLVELHDLSSLAASPDGRLVAYRQDVASVDANQLRESWWVAPVDGSTPPRQIADGGRALWTAAGLAVVEAPQWSANGRFLYYRALIDGGVGVWRAAADGSGAAPVVRDGADVTAFALDGADRLTYEVGPTRAEILAEEDRQNAAGVLIDAKVDLAQSLVDAVEINGRPAMQRFSGAWFWRAGVLGDQATQRKVVALGADGLAVAAAAKSLTAPIDTATKALTSPDGFGVVQLKRRPSATDVTVTRADGRVVACSAAVCGPDRVVAAGWRPGRDEVVLTVADRFRANRLVLWSVAAARGRTIVRTGGSLQAGANNDAPCAVTDRDALCVASEALSPPRLVRIDLRSGQVRTLVAPNEALRHDGLAARPLSWTDAQGRSFTGQWLTQADARGPRPMFMTYYNCRGYLRGGTGDQWPLIPLAAAGLSVLCVNAPSATQDTPDSVADYEQALSGLKTIVDKLAAEGQIDPRHVGMGGHSFGSEVTTWVAMKSNLLAAASVSTVQLEPTYYWLNGVAGRDTHAGLRAAWKLGAPDETPERWRALAPAANVERIKAPLLMQLPEQELRASLELVSKLTNSTTPSEVRAFAREPHILTQPRHRLAAYGRNLDWFKFWLLGETDPDPDKTEQYRRWRTAADRQGAPSPPP